VGGEIKAAAEKDLADLYPADPDGATPIAYLWARTVRCESPNCGAEIPLLRSLWLCKKPKRKRALRTKIVRPPDGSDAAPRVEFEIFAPKAEKEVAGGTVSRARASCLCCGTVLPPERVRAQLAAQKGGADVVFDEAGRRIGGARMTAVVTLKPGERGRHYRLPTKADYAAVRRAQERLAAILEEWEDGGRQGPCPVPDEPLPLMSGTFNVPLYGMNTWGDLFTARQKVALVRIVNAISQQCARSDRQDCLDALALSQGKVLRHCNVLSKWHRGSETVAGAFGMQALPMSWDFPEMFPAVDFAGGIANAQQDVSDPIECWPKTDTGQAQPADATDHPLPDQTASVWFTDPPYYFAVPYADLSDFFFVWLKRTLPGHPLLRDPFDAENELTPKRPELCEMKHWDAERYPDKDQQFFEDGMAAAFAEGRRILKEDGIGSVVFAHKTTEGWEALLSGMIRGGWTITGSWPVTTERGARLRARDSAALATSVHLITRPRPEDAPVGDWGEVLRELRRHVAAWMERLQGEGIRGADLVFACIGPALEIFSRFSRVETAEGREVGLPEYLEKVWEVVGRAALEQVLGTGEATAGSLEEDARLTALFLWTLQSTAAGNGNGGAGGEDEEAHAKAAARGLTLPFDVVRRFAQPLGIALPAWEGRIIETRKGVVRLLPVAERARRLFGDEGAGGVADWIESDAGASVQQALFPEMEGARRKKKGRRGRAGLVGADAELESPDATTLDRVHAAMLFQAGGRANALRTLIQAELDRGPAFLRLANALSALYPRGSEEKRLLDAMLLAVRR
jgi:Adenine-specific DNA methylase containing a Zn-ribbon